MPANCSADVQAVIAQIDKVYSGTNTTAINQLKNLFGLSGLSHLDDAASAREFFYYSQARALESLNENEFDCQFGTTCGPGNRCSRLLAPTPPFTSSVMRWRSRTESPLPFLGGGWSTLCLLGEITSRRLPCRQVSA